MRQMSDEIYESERKIKAIILIGGPYKGNLI